MDLRLSLAMPTVHRLPPHTPRPAQPMVPMNSREGGRDWARGLSGSVIAASGSGGGR